MSRMLRLLLGVLAVAGCSEAGNPVGTGDDGGGGGPPPASSRTPDPGLSFELGCLASLPVPNQLRTSLAPDVIPSIDRPEFLSSEDVDYLAPGERVFGLDLAGRFYAFPRKILNWHEIVTLNVSDESGSVTTSVTWCPLTFSFIEWRLPEYADFFRRGMTLGVSGSLLDNNLVVYDRDSETYWSQILGLGISGPRAGDCLEMGRNTVDTTWDLWRRLHPETLVLTNKPGKQPSSLYELNPYADYWEAKPGPPGPVAHTDQRLPAQEVVLGVHGEGGSAAVRPGSVPVGHARIGRTPAVFFRDPESNTTFVFENALDGVEREYRAAGEDEAGLPRFVDSETGTLWTLDGLAVEGPLAGRRLAQLPAYHVFWFAWATFFPERPIVDL